jgi:arylsulfatase A-like enzyme
VRRPPNILWIVTTQWRAQAFGFAGDCNARTPRLDALAAEGVNFDQAVTPHPFGPFARAALLTGVPCPGNGVRDYFDPLPDGAATIARELSARGYATAFFGKWHLSARDPEAPLVGEAHARANIPVAARGGFGFWEGFESGFQINGPWLHGTRLPEPLRFEGYQSDVVCSRAAEWIGAAPRIHPWFCLVSLESPHPPYDSPAAGMLPPDPGRIQLRANVPLGGAAEEKARRELSGYYAHIAATDRAIGRVADAVSGETALTVFTSVHGDMHGSHGLFRKGWPHEESVRVPFLVRAPESLGWATRQARGCVSHAAVSLVDLPDLALAAADGRGWRPRGDWAALSMPSVVRLPHQCDRVWRGVRGCNRKLVLDGDRRPWLFFDLESDPLELHNLAGDPSRASEVREWTGRCGPSKPC